MEIKADKFILCEKQACCCTFSLKAAVASSALDFSIKAETRYSAGEWMTFHADNRIGWKTVLAGFYNLVITVVDNACRVVKQAVCRAAQVCKKFACSNLCRGCRVVPMVPMALRL
jgi:hypothetical protein